MKHGRSPQVNDTGFQDVREQGCESIFILGGASDRKMGEIHVRGTNFICSPNIIQDYQVEEGEMVEVCSSYDRMRQVHAVAKTFGKQGMGEQQQSRHRSNRM